MAKIKKFWSRISLQKKLYLIFGLMAVVVVFELLILSYTMSNLSAVRAFVYGESVWSKAQKDSVYYLQRMSLTKDEKYYEAYKKSLFVPHECRLARLELLKPEPNMKLVRRGFINGKIHPDDVGPILHMIRTFAWLEHIEIALRTWREADEILQEFERVAVLYHDAVMASDTDSVEVKKHSQRIHDLNLELGKAEDRFSEALQNGARWLENVALISLLSLVVIVEVTGFLLVFFFGSSLSKGLNNLIEASGRIGRGEFGPELPVDSEDEVGQLTRSVNQMGTMIQYSHSELERMIEERTQELNQAIKTRDEFYSIATHELKTPVTAIQLSLQMLEKKLKSKDQELEREKLLGQIHKCVELAHKLTSLQDTLMDVTRISAGLFTVNKTEQDLMETVRNAVEQSRISEFDRPIEITGPDKCIAIFDSVRIGQVISNLVKNALKYGGEAPVMVEVIEKENTIQIMVRDQGPGIPSELHEKIFEQFIRVNADAGISGLGMGLYISRKIMEAHGGTLKVLSSSQKGTTFCASLSVKGQVSAVRNEV